MPTFHNQMTKQEVFDALCEVSKAGGFPSWADIGCAYRGDNGRACAIGVFIPDDLAAALDANGGADADISSGDTHERCRPHLPDWMTREVATAIQSAHDNSRTTALGPGKKKAVWDHAEFVARLTVALGLTTPTESQS